MYSQVLGIGMRITLGGQYPACQRRVGKCPNKAWNLSFVRNEVLVTEAFKQALTYNFSKLIWKEALNSCVLDYKEQSALSEKIVLLT